jgi:Rad3-related DNA helicase
MGGAFSEGVDLTGESLIGVAVIGVGLPQVNIYQRTLMDYYTESRGDGFAYAYVYPGINKVMQAGGRLIRTETDKGVILLIDERFAQSGYKNLLPEQWRHIIYAHGPDEICAKLDRFYNNFPIADKRKL